MTETHQRSDLPSVYVVVLHWRGLDFTRRCLESLRTSDYPNLTILLVDNGSDNHDGEILKQTFNEITLLRLEENRGYSGGNNAGIRYAMDENANFIWLLNNDAIVFPETLAALVNAAIKDEHAGATGGLLYEEAISGNDTRPGKGRGVIDFIRAKSFLEYPLTNDITPCDWLSGSSLLLRASAIENTGALNDSYFLYFEDVELCFRLRQNGWRCLLVPKSKITHTGYASTSGERLLWRHYYGARNRLYFFHQNTTGLTWLNCMSRLFGRLIKHIITMPFLNPRKRTKLRGEALATRDFISCKTGKADWL